MDKVLRVQGTCMLMCPEQEIRMREKEGLLHILEIGQYCKGKRVVADRRKMVKMFTRSAAGKDMSHVDVLRPHPVLKKTINYLLGTIVCESEVSWSTACMFVTDRLRAVRQDMVIQQLPPAICASLLEPIVRFHAYAAYRLCEESADVFDPHLNWTHLNESLKQLLVYYDSCLTDKNEMSTTRDQMEALYGLLHLGNVDALNRMLFLQPSRNSLLHVALKMSIADFHNDYVTVLRLFITLPVLLACVVALHLPRVRRKALSTMNCAYSSKNLRYPLDLLSKLLFYSDHEEAVQDCQHYGITVKDNSVHFLKGMFLASAKKVKPKKLYLIEKGLMDISLPELLLTASQKDS